VRIARDAIAMARRLGDRRGLLHTIHDGLSAMMDVVDPRERLTLNREVETLAGLVGDRERLLRTHARLALDHLSLGEFAEADARIDAFEALAGELRASWILWRAPLFRAVRAATHGRFDEAEQLEQRARALSLKTQDPQAERALIFHREGFLRVAERHGDMRALDARARRERASFHNGPSWQSVGSALLFTRLEDADQVRAHLAAIPDDLRPPIDNLFALFFIAEPAALVGPAELAQKIYDLLLPNADQYVMLGMTHVQWEGPVARLLGLLAARLGRWETAVSHFEDALDRLQRLDARPHLARTRYEFGRALLQRAAEDKRAGGDVQRARQLLRAAHEQAEDLGLTALATLAEGRLAEAGTDDAGAANASVSPPPPARAAGGGSRAGETVEFTLALEGEYWTLSPGSSTSGAAPIRLKDSLGLQYIARLLAEPGRELHVLELVSPARGTAATGAGPDAGIDLGDAGEHLDEDARADYRRRLDDLRETLAEAESFGDGTRAARAQAEIEFLAAELGRAVGLGGRARRSGSAAERARSAVQRRIKNALGRIDEADAAVGALLARRIRTGNFCVYRPDA
jgi:tetratricopeptide (TPR) repeat protein